MQKQVSPNPNPISRVPPEVLAIVLQHLEEHEFLSAANIINKRWRSAVTCVSELRLMKRLSEDYGSWKLRLPCTPIQRRIVCQFPIMSPSIVGTIKEITIQYWPSYRDFSKVLTNVLRLRQGESKKGERPAALHADERLMSTPLTGLTKLTLRACRVTDNELLFVANLKNLTNLDISDNDTFTIVGVKAITALRQLKVLILAGCRSLADNDLIELTGLTELQYLSLDGCWLLSDASVRELGKLLKLKTLLFEKCRMITGTSFESLASIPTLDMLCLRDCDGITDTGVKALSATASLTVLDVSGCSLLTDDSVKSLSKMNQLRRLNLLHLPKLTPPGLQELVSCKSLERLFFSVPPGDADTVAYLSRTIPHVFSCALPEQVFWTSASSN